MSPKLRISRNSVDSCLFQLNSWKPFSGSKTLDSNPNPNSKTTELNTKRRCLPDRATSLFSLSIDAIDFSKLSLFEDGGVENKQRNRREKLRLSSSLVKKRRRKCGSRSDLGRSSDRGGTRNCKGCSIGGMTTTACSDVMVGNGGTDSSGELFVGNGWVKEEGGEVRKENVGGGCNVGVGGEIGVLGVGFDASESGYGSEPGYRGDVEYGYGDEGDEDEEEGARLLKLWGEALGVGDSNTEMVGENTFTEQKIHQRGRRKKHDLKMVDSVR